MSKALNELIKELGTIEEFFNRLQETIDEISGFYSAEFLTPADAIYSTIDLEEVEE